MKFLILLFPIGSITKIEISNEDADSSGLVDENRDILDTDPTEHDKLEGFDRLDEDKLKE